MTETQKSVYQWCKATFPKFAGLKGRAIALVEEAVELALAAGVNPEAIRAAANVPILKEEETHWTALAVPNRDAEEVADALLCVYAYAEEAGYDAHRELDEKMALNRGRPQEYYDGKTAHKEELGYVLPAPPQQIIADEILRRIAMRYRDCSVNIYPELPELTPVEAVLRCAAEEGFWLTNMPPKVNNESTDS
jgi:hypothetical protein